MMVGRKGEWEIPHQEEEGGGTGDWTKLTDLGQLNEGTKVVFACQQYNVVAGGLMDGKNVLNAVSCENFSGNIITEMPAGTFLLVEAAITAVILIGVSLALGLLKLNISEDKKKK